MWLWLFVVFVWPTTVAEGWASSQREPSLVPRTPPPPTMSKSADRPGRFGSLDAMTAHDTVFLKFFDWETAPERERRVAKSRRVELTLVWE